MKGRRRQNPSFDLSMSLRILVSNTEFWGDDYNIKGINRLFTRTELNVILSYTWKFNDYNCKLHLTLCIPMYSTKDGSKCLFEIDFSLVYTGDYYKIHKQMSWIFYFVVHCF